MTEPALRVSNLSKHFGEFAALSEVSLEIEPGEIRGLVGSNGSGKSTFVKILAGYHAPDSGAHGSLWGHSLAFPIRNAPGVGIATIHQDLGLWGGASAVENYGLASSYGTRPTGPINWRKEKQSFERLCARFGFSVPPDALVSWLGPAERTLVALARALRELEEYSGHHLLLLDEPTVSFGRQDVERLFRVLRVLAEQGSAVLFIAHRLGEVLEISHRVSVLRDGHLVETVNSNESSPADLLRRMLGRDLGGFFPEKRRRTPGSVVLRAEGLRGESGIDVSFEARAGEVLGITGLVGMGQDVLPYLIAGDRQPAAGRVTLGDKAMGVLTLTSMASEGFALVPADRLRYGLWADATATENTTLPRLSTYFARLHLDHRRETSEVASLMVRLAVRPPNAARQMSTFSGGNQQKLILGRALMQQPRLLLLHEPTMGVDAGARKEILGTIEEVAALGCCVLIFSVEYEELAAMCDRVLIMDGGQIARQLEGEFSQDDILRACHAA